MIDITRALVPGHPVWPGDVPFSLEPSWTMAKGQPANVMALHSTTHLGTHLDAPYHYQENGERLGKIPLSLLVGEALVLDAQAENPLSPRLLEGYDSLPQRVLFFTGQPDAWRVFPEEFPALSGDLVRVLAKRGVRLVGTDAPSVDPLDSKSLPVHRACGQYGLHILESLALSRVRAPGRYRLVALPMRLEQADAAPVRAILETV